MPSVPSYEETSPVDSAPSYNETQPIEEGVHIPEIVQKGVKGIQTMRRGVRGAAVGAENAILLDPSDSDFSSHVIERANEALKPGYKPKDGEKLAVFGSGVVDPINLLISRLIPGSGLSSSAAIGAGMSSVDNVLDQIEKTGRIDPKEVGISSLLGGATGIGVHAGVHGLTSAIENAPSILKALGNIPKRATKILMENPDLMKNYKGTQEEIDTLTRNVQDVANDVRQGASRHYDAVLSKLGLKKTAEERIASRPLKPTEIPVKYKQITSGESGPTKELPKMVGGMKSEEMTPQLRAALAKAMEPKDVPLELQKVVQGKNKLSTTDQLKGLLRIRQSIDHYVDFSNETIKPVLEGGRSITKEQASGLLHYRKLVNEQIEKIDGGSFIRNADERLHRAATIFGDLQQHLSTPGKAEKFLRDTFENDTPASRENLKNLMALEEESKKPVIKELFNSLSSAEFRKKLYTARLRSTFGGISAFIISRALHIPYAVSVGLAAASQSPALVGRVVKAGMRMAPLLEESTTPGVLGAESYLHLGADSYHKNHALLQGSSEQK